MMGLTFNDRRTVALLAFSMVAIASWAQVFEQDGIKYRYESESLSVVVVSVFGKGDIVVPRTVVYNEQELPVTGMMSECFMDNKDSSVRSASDSKAIYNINGHRLASPQKGINIQNGKKVIIKK